MQKGKIQLKIQIQIQIKQKLEYTKLPGHAGVQLHVWLQNESGGNRKHYRSENAAQILLQICEQSTCIPFVSLASSGCLGQIQMLP